MILRTLRDFEEYERQRDNRPVPDYWTEEEECLLEPEEDYEEMIRQEEERRKV